MEPAIYREKDVLALVRISKATLWRWRKAGGIPPSDPVRAEHGRLAPHRNRRMDFEPPARDRLKPAPPRNDPEEARGPFSEGARAIEAQLSVAMKNRA